MGRPRMPADIRASVVGRLKAGNPVTATAREFGICHTTALTWYREDTGKTYVGNRARRGPPQKYPRDEWLDMYRRGLSIGQIAIKHGVRRWSVAGALRKMSETGRIRDLRGGANG